MLRFNEYGYLPPGDHEMTFSEIRQSVLIQGEEWLGAWDQAWRLMLLQNLEQLAHELWQVGIEDIYINGSFCSIKAKPDDIDGFYVIPINDDILNIADSDERKQAVFDEVLSYRMRAGKPSPSGLG